MAVVGLDFGSDTCYIAVARDGGIETIDNTDSSRCTPSYVGFTTKQRVMGTRAKNQAITHVTNTIHNFKRMLGLRCSDPFVQDQMKKLEKYSYKVTPVNHDHVGVKVYYLGQETIFTLEQVVSMLLTNLKESAESVLGTKVRECVISVPSYFSMEQRVALLKAAQIAGLNCLRLLSEPAATALGYAVYKKKELPALNSDSRKVFFLDFGHSSLQIFACEFSKESYKVIACYADPFIGGRDLDEMLAEYFCDDFKARYQIDPRTNAKAYTRLLTEVEKLKKQMSATTAKVSFNIECFMDTDVSGEMCRSEFEKICAPLFQRVEKSLHWMYKSYTDSCFATSKIHSFEIVGGSSRLPTVKTMIEQIFGMSPSTSMNQDEAVSRGCAIECALISPSVKISEYKLIDVLSYSIMVKFTNPNGHGTGPEPFKVRELYHAFGPLEAGRLLEIEIFQHFHGPLYIETYYGETFPSFANRLAQFEVSKFNYPPNSTCKVQFWLDKNGILNAVTAGCELPPPPQENGNATEKSNTEREREPPKSIMLKVNKVPSEYSPEEMANMRKLIEFEEAMIRHNNSEKERAQIKNSLEEYVFQIQREINEEHSDWKKFTSEKTHENFFQLLDEERSWLENDDDTATSVVYRQRLEKLKEFGAVCEAVRKGKQQPSFEHLEDDSNAVKRLKTPDSQEMECEDGDEAGLP